MFVEGEGNFDPKDNINMSHSKRVIKLTKNGQVRPCPNFITRLRMKTPSGEGDPGDHSEITPDSNHNNQEKSQTTSTNLPDNPQPQKSPVSSPPSRSKDSEGKDTSVTSCDSTARDPPTLSDNEDLLLDVLEVIEDIERKDLEEKSSEVGCSIDESFDWRCSDLPVIYNFEVFEEEVYNGIQVFDQIEEIEKHDHNMMEIKPPTPGRKQKKAEKVMHECKICSKVFMRLSEFTEHEKIHQIDIICDICGKIQRSAIHLINHRNHHHPDLPRYEEPCQSQCQGDGGGSGTRTRERGKEGAKTKTQSFCCKSCGSVFDSRSLLMNHKMLQHNMHPPRKTKKTTPSSSKHIQWRKKAEQDLSRALSKSKKFRGS